MTDREKHEWCELRNGFGALILDPWFYRMIESQGYDMRWYVMRKPILWAGGPIGGASGKL